MFSYFFPAPEKMKFTGNFTKYYDLNNFLIISMKLYYLSS